MRRPWTLGLICLAALAACQSKDGSEKKAPVEESPPAPLPFEEEILAFEAADQRQAPAPGQVVFVGSSSIRMWKSLAEDMAPTPVLNRGFGGSEFSDAVRYVDRIVTSYRPSAVVVYSGDNDVTNGKEVDEVVEDYTTFVARVRDKAPAIPILVLSVKPSPARMAHWPAMRRVNRAMQEHCGQSEDTIFVDVASMLLDESGAIRQELFLADGIHLNAEGYRGWTSTIKPVLQTALQR